MKKWMATILMSLILLPALSGCAGLLIGGVATGAVLANDRRTAGTIVEDQSIELKAKHALKQDDALRTEAHLVVVSFNNSVLLAGEAPNSALKQRAEKIVGNTEKVRRVHNELKVSAPTSMGSRSSDTLITTKVKSKLFGAAGLENFDATRIKVVTVNGAVYLMGLMTRPEGTAASDATRTVKGVERVVKLFEYIN